MWHELFNIALTLWRKPVRTLCANILLYAFSGLTSHAQVLTPVFEVKLIENVSNGWQTVSLENNYTSAVVVCTYNLPSISANPAIPRVRNVTATSFELRGQTFENNSVTASDMHCLIADEGAYNIGGLKFEARTVVSDGTSGSNAEGWDAIITEDVTSAITQSYTSPLVLGQVMSFNDTDASAFWSHNCDKKNKTPFINVARICVGKNIGKIADTRSAETLGYIVAETGSGTQNDVQYELARGSRDIEGVGNIPPYTYTLSGDYDIGVATQTAQYGEDGAWAVLYGNDPLPTNTINLAVDEEVVTGGTYRAHLKERVAYWVFKDNQFANLSFNETVSVSSESVSPYAIPGADVLYTIEVENLGSKSVDQDSVVIIDSLQDEASFYLGDIDGGGPETGSIIFTSSGSGLTFTQSTDLAFSTSATKPTSFAQCNATPAPGYNPQIHFICLNPKGAFSEGALTSSSFTITFRAQIK